MAAAASFWEECERCHGLAERFQRGIDITHPDRLTGRSGYYSECGCAWCAEEVTYFEYRGERL